MKPLSTEQQEIMAVTRHFAETNQAAKTAYNALVILRKNMTSNFLTPEIEKEIRNALGAIEDIRQESTEMMCAIYVQKLLAENENVK